MWGRAEGGAPISALKHKLSIRGLSPALIWGRTLSHKDPGGGRKYKPRSCQTNTWKKMSYYWLICVLANTSDMLKPSLWPLAIETLRNLIYTSVFLSVAVPTIKLSFVFLYNVIGSSAFHNYDGYTVWSNGSICYTNDSSSTVADKMEPLIRWDLNFSKPSFLPFYMEIDSSRDGARLRRSTLSSKWMFLKA